MMRLLLAKPHSEINHVLEVSRAVLGTLFETFYGM